MYKNNINISLEESNFHRDLESSKKNLKLIDEWENELPNELTLDFNFELAIDIKSKKKSLNVPFKEMKLKKTISNKELF